MSLVKMKLENFSRLIAELSFACGGFNVCAPCSVIHVSHKKKNLFDILKEYDMSDEAIQEMGNYLIAGGIPNASGISDVCFDLDRFLYALTKVVVITE